MVLQAIGSQGTGVDKLLVGKELREYAEKMYLTASLPCPVRICDPASSPKTQDKSGRSGPIRIPPKRREFAALEPSAQRVLRTPHARSPPSQASASLASQAEARDIAGCRGEKNFGSGRVFLYLTGTLYG
jgi:hypothetical protein